MEPLVNATLYVPLGTAFFVSALVLIYAIKSIF